MVIPRSRSRSIVSRYCSRIRRASTAPHNSRMRSASVLLPWSTWLSSEKHRLREMSKPDSGRVRAATPGSASRSEGTRRVHERSDDPGWRRATARRRRSTRRRPPVRWGFGFERPGGPAVRAHRWGYGPRFVGGGSAQEATVPERPEPIGGRPVRRYLILGATALSGSLLVGLWRHHPISVLLVAVS